MILHLGQAYLKAFVSHLKVLISYPNAYNKEIHLQFAIHFLFVDVRMFEVQVESLFYRDSNLTKLNESLLYGSDLFQTSE